MPSPSRASSPSCPASGAAFAFLFAYHFVFAVVFALLLLAADSGSGLAALTAFLVAIAYLAGLVYLSVVCLLASVVSVLENYKGLDAMRKSKALIQARVCAVVMLALVVQTVLYLVCKSYHHESIDKRTSPIDHLEVYLGDYVPLKASDVQMEQLHV